LGLKGSLADGRFSANSAVFETDWSNKQQAVNLACGFSFSGNLGSSTIRGVEFSGDMRVIQGLTVGLDLTYLKSEVNQTVVELNEVKGDPLPMTPTWEASVHSQYTWPIGGKVDAFARIDANYRDSIIEPERKNVLPSYSAGNLSVGITTDKYNLSAFVHNVTDSRGIIGDESFNIVSLPTTRQVYSITPRTIGLNYRYRF
jgi:outer membrane receptor protein involved in Fe transport